MSSGAIWPSIAKPRKRWVGFLIVIVILILLITPSLPERLKLRARLRLRNLRIDRHFGTHPRPYPGFDIASAGSYA